MRPPIWFHASGLLLVALSTWLVSRSATWAVAIPAVASVIHLILTIRRDTWPGR